MITKAEEIEEILQTMEVGDELKKSDIVDEIWGKGSGEDYFKRRSFDVHLCKAKAKMKTESGKEFNSNVWSQITRIT